MLAQSAADVDEALAELGEASLEYKIDGARIQVHKAGREVRVFSRSLRDVTVAVPEIVEAVQSIGPRDAIFDAEAIVVRPDGIPHPFQITMRRFGRKLDVDRLRESLPITPVCFDCLYLDGQSLIDEPLSRRAAALDRASSRRIAQRPPRFWGGPSPPGTKGSWPRRGPVSTRRGAAARHG
jgi:DNA ligase-1